MKHSFKNQIKAFSKTSIKLLALKSIECQIVSTLIHRVLVSTLTYRVLKVKEGQSQKSKIVKPSGAVGFQGLPAPARTVPHIGRVYARASWKLQAGSKLGLQAASWEQAVKYTLNKMYVHF